MESYVIYSCIWLLSHDKIYGDLATLLHVSVICSFLLLSSIPNLFIHFPIDGHQDCFPFLYIIIDILLGAFLNKSFNRHIFSVFLDNYLGMKLLSYRVDICLDLWKKSQFPKLPLAMNDSSSCSTFLKAFGIVSLFYVRPPKGCIGYNIVVST